MARRSKKPKAPSTTPAGAGPDTGGGHAGDEGRPVDPNLALFASYVHDDRQRAQTAKRAAREQRRQAEEAEALVRAKDAAAAEVKRLRSRSSATAEERAAADTTYREALAAVVAAETGEAPAWAPPPSIDDEPTPAEPGVGEDAAADSNAEDESDESGDGTDDRAAEDSA